MKHQRGKVMRTKEWPDGLSVSRSHFRRAWQRTCAAAGVRQLRVHDLRVSNISWLLAAGVDLPTVMHRVGHTQWATTQRYVTALDEADQRAVTALDEFRARRRAHKSTGN